jgi:hypothetical protein
MFLFDLILAGCSTAPPSAPAEVPCCTTQPETQPDARAATGATGSSCSPAAALVLNEVSPATSASLLDVEGDTPDWIELFNADQVPIDLSGWTLSDDPDEPDKWTLPALTLDPGAFQLVHASGKDRARIVGSWETRVDQGHAWRYLPVVDPPDLDWYVPDFDDSDWDTGPSGFGRGDSDDTTQVDADTVYVRTEIELTAAELDDLTAMALHVDFDDGFAAYLNGVEVARVALGLRGSGPPPWDAPATYANEALIKEDQRPAYFDLDASIGLLQEGSNTLALEVHNSSPDSSDVTLIPLLSLGFATQGDSVVSDVLALPNVDLHTNFALRASGEAVRLFDPAGCEADELDPEPLRADESYGRQPDGTGALGYFVAPTPGAPNLTESRPGFASTPVLDPPPAYYAGGTAVEIEAGANARIYYAYGGWEPTEAGLEYTAPIHTGTSGEASVLRARAWEDGLWPSRIATATYLLREPGDLPVVSLVTDPPNLWDDEIGIYVIGDGNPEFPYSGANFNEDWQRPVHFEGWEPDGTLGFAVDGAVAIHGGNSRRHEQKNFEVELSGGWGDDAIEHQVFPGLDITSFSRLVLRAGGGDWLGCYGDGCIGGTLYRDRLMHDLTVGTDLDRMASRPAVAYLNGDYWGIYFLNEKSDGTYVEDHHGQDDIDMLRNNAIPRQGDEASYLEMLEWLRSHDLADPANYAHAQTLIDIDELQTYLIFQVFYDNRDWPGNNIEFWRPRSEDGRWRWILFGTDLGLGADEGDPDEDSLSMALQPDGDGWPNPDWSTELFRLLVDNPEFVDTFVNRYADYLNTLLLPERTQDLNSQYADELAPEVPRHVDRWGSWTDGTQTYTLDGDEWEIGVDHVDWWLGERPAEARAHVVEAFGLAGTWTLTLEADPPGSGTFELSAVTVPGPFEGTYFQGVPVTITAHPEPGYTFVGWDNPWVRNLPTVRVNPSGGGLDLVATFQ